MTAILIVCILLLALLVRMLPVIYDISGGHVLFSGLDSYYHMRRIMYTVDHFPSTNVFDSYVNFPSGFPIYWPPLYDQISAGLSLLAGLGHPGRLHHRAGIRPGACAHRRALHHSLIPYRQRLDGQVCGHDRGAHHGDHTGLHIPVSLRSYGPSRAGSAAFADHVPAVHESLIERTRRKARRYH